MTRITGAWLAHPGTRAVTDLFQQAGHRIFFVGGCVRNALLGAPVNDIDLATDAVPSQSLALADSAGLKAIPTGLDHGTVTIVADGIAHEVTTFRSDQQTDGRHAKVRFSTDPTEDAKRRDFTMNGLYADASGEVWDWVDGLVDIEARRVRFIGDATARISEDFLRILRFFRFHAWYGDPMSGLDAEGLAACAAGQNGIMRLSGERIGAEMCKLLGAPDPAPAVASMSQSGILARVLPGSDHKALAPLVHLDTAFAPSWIRRAAILGGKTPKEAWRLSRKDTNRLDLIRSKLGSTESAAELGYRHGAESAIDIALCRAALLESTVSDTLAEDAARGASAIFPVRARDLPGYEGPALGNRLRALEARWIASDFSMTRSALLAL